jgi:hypothetical protein
MGSTVARYLDQQRAALDDKRQAIAHERVRDPTIANALIGAVILAASALPLVLAVFVLRGAIGINEGHNRGSHFVSQMSASISNSKGSMCPRGFAVNAPLVAAVTDSFVGGPDKKPLQTSSHRRSASLTM